MSLLDLNLLPSGAKFQAAKIKLRKSLTKITIGIVSAWLLLVVMVFGLIIVAKMKLDSVQTQYKKAEDAYMAMSDDIVTSQSLKYRAKLVGQLLDSRFEYGKAFEEIRGFLPSGVQLTDFQLRGRGGFSLSATTDGGKNMDAVEMLVDSINKNQNDKFSSAKLTILSYSKDVWSFSMEVGLK